MAGLPFNPMSFVTPYTAVSTANAGKAFGDSMAQAKASKVSEGYLANTQHQTAENDKRYGQKQMDDARERLDGALMSGNQDAVELAANNLRAIAGRYGFSLSETRSDAQLKSGVSTPVGKQEAEVGTEEKPFDVDAYDAGKARKPDPSAFTGLQQGEEADLAQGDFEKQLIDGYKPRDSYERGGKTTPETLAAIRPPGGSLPVAAPQQVDDLGDVDSPEFKAAAAAEKGTPIRVPGGSLPMAPASPVAEPPGTSEAPLRGYTINGPDGKPIYSVAPKDIMGRQQKRVGDVFTALASKTDDPQELRWLEQAKAETEKLVGIMPLDEAVKTGLSHYVGQMNSRDKLTMVEANHKPRFGGGGGGAPAMASGVVGGKEGQVLGQLSDDELQLIQHFKANSRFPAMEEADRGARAALNSLNSSNPASQFFAIRQLIQSMSGKTVGAKEEGFYSRMSGLVDEIANKFNMAAGEEMTPEYRDKVKTLLQEMAAYYANERADLGRQAASYYEGRMQDRADGEYVARHKPYVEGAFTGVYPSAPKATPRAASKTAPPKKSMKDLE